MAHREGDRMTPTPPALAVLVVTSHRGATLRRTLLYLQTQTIADRIELFLIGPDGDSFDDLDPSATAGFGRCCPMAIGPIEEVERAFAPGILAASAPVVALLENHVYPDPDWGAAIVRAFEGPWSVVGSVITNANTDTATSWVEHFLTYGFHDEAAPGGEVARVARNNSAFRRDVLMAFGAQLPDILARDGGLLETLQRGGHRFFREPRARMQHLNPSRLGSMLRLRVQSARASSDTRARAGRWSRGRRLLYVAASPLFPMLRLRALWPRLRAHPARGVLLRIAPLLALALVVESVGQALGFAFGAGDSAVRAGQYDLDRAPHLNAADCAHFMP
jgi:hypothetical protein